jgi:hypothetical protein
MLPVRCPGRGPRGRVWRQYRPAGHCGASQSPHRGDSVIDEIVQAVSPTSARRSRSFHGRWTPYGSAAQPPSVPAGQPQQTRPEPLVPLLSSLLGLEGEQFEVGRVQRRREGRDVTADGNVRVRRSCLADCIEITGCTYSGVHFVSKRLSDISRTRSTTSTAKHNVPVTHLHAVRPNDVWSLYGLVGLPVALAFPAGIKPRL